MAWLGCSVALIIPAPYLDTSDAWSCYGSLVPRFSGSSKTGESPGNPDRSLDLELSFKKMRHPGE